MLSRVSTSLPLLPAVWYISKYFNLPQGRVGSRAFMLLREFPKYGVQPVVVTAAFNHLGTDRELGGELLRERVSEIDIIWLKLRKYKGARSLGRILSWLEFEWRLWRLSKNDLPPPSAIIVSSLSLLTIFNGLLLRRRFGCRLIFEVRDIWPLTIIEEGGFSPNNPFVAALQWVEKLAYRKADAIVGTMPNLIEHVSNLVRTTAPVSCIPMGVAPDLIEDHQPLPTAYVAKYIPKDKFIVCHAGTIGQTNALDVFFEAAGLLKDEPIHFLLVGDGDLKASYQQAFQHLANVSFAPAVPKRQVSSLLSYCDTTYFSTFRSKIWDYGLSLNKLIDYMLAAKPVIGSYSGYPSMINEAGCGSLVPAGDAAALQAELLKMSRMPEADRTVMGQKGREWILANRDYALLARQYLGIALPDIDREEAIME
jgi:glycosyltransferase involved in cell wall biosynthesis